MAQSGGQPGNQNGRRGTMFRDQLIKIINQEAASLPEAKQRLRQAAMKLLSLAADGEEWAVKELANRCDGKSPQAVELTGHEGDALNFFDPANLRNLDAAESEALRALLKKAAKGAE